jgi:hypothetical protein
MGSETEVGANRMGMASKSDDLLHYEKDLARQPKPRLLPEGPKLVNMTKYKDHRCVRICATGDGGNIRKQLTQEVTRIATNRGCHLRASVYIRSLLLPVLSRIRALELPQLHPSK